MQQSAYLAPPKARHKCVYTYIYIYTHSAYLYIYIIYTHIHMYIQNTNMCIEIIMQINAYIYIYLFIYLCIYTHEDLKFWFQGPKRWISETMVCRILLFTWNSKVLQTMAHVPVTQGIKRNHSAYFGGPGTSQDLAEHRP